MTTSTATSELMELPEQPADSIVQVQETSDGITLTIPWGAGLAPLAFISILVSVGFGLLLYDVVRRLWEGAVLDHEWTLWAFFASVGVGVLLVAGYHFLQKTILTISQQTLSIRRLTWFGSEQHHWHSRQLADVFVRYWAGDPDMWRLHIHPLPGEGNEFNLECKCRVNDLRWLATVLRHRLHCPGNAPNSPPPGYIVVTSCTSWTDAEPGTPP